MRNDKGGEKREEGISDRFNRGNKVDRSTIGCLNGAVCKCGYGTEGKIESAYYECDNFKIREGNFELNKFVVEMIVGMKESEVERRIYGGSEKKEDCKDIKMF